MGNLLNGQNGQNVQIPALKDVIVLHLIQTVCVVAIQLISNWKKSNKVEIVDVVLMTCTPQLIVLKHVTVYKVLQNVYLAIVCHVLVEKVKSIMMENVLNQINVLVKIPMIQRHVLSANVIKN